MDIKADNLAPVYRELAEKIGLQNTLILYNEFRGSQVHFGTSLFSKEFIHQTIIKEYNEEHISAAKLASKHHLSERTVKRILQSQNTVKSEK